MQLPNTALQDTSITYRVSSIRYAYTHNTAQAVFMLIQLYYHEIQFTLFSVFYWTESLTWVQ